MAGGNAGKFREFMILSRCFFKLLFGVYIWLELELVEKLGGAEMSLVDSFFDRVAWLIVFLYSRVKRPKSGFCLVVEAMDGAGKTTQLKNLVEWFDGLGVKSISAREPGGTQTGEKVRDILLGNGNAMTSLTEVFLFAASRIESINQVVNPALAAGFTVILDRHIESSIAYQGFGRGIKTWFVRLINIFGTVSADLKILIIVDRAVADARQMGRGEGDRFETEAEVFKNMVDKGYRWLARKYPGQYIVVDGSGSSRDVFEQIKAAIIRERPDIFR